MDTEERRFILGCWQISNFIPFGLKIDFQQTSSSGSDLCLHIFFLNQLIDLIPEVLLYVIWIISIVNSIDDDGVFSDVFVHEMLFLVLSMDLVFVSIWRPRVAVLVV